jgi:hypothetical protein
MGTAGAVVYTLSLATAPWVVDRPVTQWASKTVGRKAVREDRFQLSGAEWTARPSTEAPGRAADPDCFSLLTGVARGQRCLIAYPGRGAYECARWGHVAEWLRNGLQIAGGFTRVTHVQKFWKP